MLFLIIRGAESQSNKGFLFIADFVGVLAVNCDNQPRVTHTAPTIH